MSFQFDGESSGRRRMQEDADERENEPVPRKGGFNFVGKCEQKTEKKTKSPMVGARFTNTDAAVVPHRGQDPTDLVARPLGKSSSSGSGHQKQVTGRGRGSPTTPQAPINIVCAVNLVRLYQERSKTERIDAYAPVGTLSDFVIMEKDLVWSVVVRGGHRRKGPIGYGDMYVFGCVNGLPRGTPLMFVGQCLNRVGVEIGETMDVCTVQRAGTITIENTGRRKVVAGDIIIWHNQPYTVGEGKAMKPAVAAHGKPSTQFTPEVTSLHETSTLVLSATIMDEHRIVAAKMAPRTGTLRAGEAFKMVYEAMDRASDSYFIGEGYTSLMQPIQLHARWDAFSAAMAIVNVTAVREIDSKDLSVVEAAQKIANDIMQAELEMYSHESPGGGVLDGILTESVSNSITQTTTPVTTIEDAHDVWSVLLVDLQKKRSIRSLIEQEMWIRQHVIGRSTSGAERGQPYDCLLGYTHV